MDKKGVKFAKGGKNGDQEPLPSRSKTSVPGLPAITIAKPSSNGSNGLNGSSQKSKLDTPPKTASTILPTLGGSTDGTRVAPPSGKSSRKMSAADQGPQTAEFAYSKAVEQALRKYGFWSSRPLPRGFKTKYLEAEIPSLNDIYQDYVFMRRTRGESTSGPPQNFDEFRAVPLVSRSLPEPPPPEPSLPTRTPVGRDTPMPRRLRSGSVSRFPSLAVEIRMKKPPRTPKKQSADGASSRSVSVVSMSIQ